MMQPTQTARPIDAANMVDAPPPDAPPGQDTSMRAMVDGVPTHIEIPHAAPAEAPRTPVAKLVLVDRLIAAGLVDNALAALGSDPVAKLRFDAAVEIAPDDAQVRAFLGAIGGDPDELLS